MLKDRAKQVVLAVAAFDEEGRLLVSQSGLMPCQTITQQFHQSVRHLSLHMTVSGLTGARVSMMSSTLRIRSFSGFSVYHVIGQAY